MGKILPEKFFVHISKYALNVEKCARIYPCDKMPKDKMPRDKMVPATK